MTELLVQIPCKNEEDNIRQVIESIPRKIPGVSKVDVLVIDDSSTDSTVDFAIQAGADFVIKKNRHKGLANSFSLGTSFFLDRGYDILVNTDGDNQYFQEKIPELIAPVQRFEAELAVGDRHVNGLKHFSRGKRALQKIGSRVVTLAAGVQIGDAATGFRAYSRDLVARLNITTKFSYAMETLVQAGNSGCRVISVRCGARKVSRPSRLFKNNREHVIKSAQAILRGLVTYRPLFTFLSISAIMLLLGIVPFLRYFILVGAGSEGDHLQSLIIGTVLLLGSFSAASLAILADTVRANRLISEKQLALQRLASNGSEFSAAMQYFDAHLVHGS